MDRVHKTIAGTRHTITRRQVLAELVRYDREYPANDYDERPGGPGWLDAATYHYALVHEGRLYPPKYLLHRLTGASPMVPHDDSNRPDTSHAASS